MLFKETWSSMKDLLDKLENVLKKAANNVGNTPKHSQYVSKS